jgi:hypothetical protein
MYKNGWKRMADEFHKKNQLAFIIPQLISLARVKSFTKELWDHFWPAEIIIGESKIFFLAKVSNVVETGIFVIQGTRMNDLNAREKQVDKSSSAESGFFMTYDKNE